VRESCDGCGAATFEIVNEAGPECLTGDFKIVPGTIQNVLCTSCGIVWNRSMMEGAALQAFYAGYEKKTDGAREDDLLFDPMGGAETLGRNQIGFLARALPQGSVGRVLDVGCGKGSLLGLFAESLPGWERWGVEPSAAAAAIARADAGLTVLEGMLDTVEIAESSCDLVTIVHVLEHAASPSAVLSDIHRVLKPDGLLFVEVPNMLDANMFYDLVLHEHLFHFTPETLESLLGQHGFRTESVEPSTAYGAQRFLARRAGPPRGGAAPIAPLTLTRLRRGGVSWRRMWTQLHENASALAAAASRGQRVALFGAGMTTAVLLTYTALRGAPLVALIDESPWKVGRTYFGHAIRSLADLGSLDVDVIGVATIPSSQPMVQRKLRETLNARPGRSDVPEVTCLVEG
jgi:SAM-dependent methyltransferase